MNDNTISNAYSMKTIDRALYRARVERARVFHAAVRSLFGGR